ncbi:hypothetical protein M9Y10_026206 [Tritrichomonas musculus]|uniref:Protein kinase domain-containing protein n=1 Tax=Tritrichomonas musculus TaxID=1915356 RepID=A0ABR2H6Y7_9EUKA
MEAGLNELQSFSTHNQIKMSNPNFDKIINRFSFLLINQENQNVKKIIEVKPESDLLIFDKCINNSNTYFNFCFDNILFVIKPNDLKIITPFLFKNEHIKIFSLSNDATQLFKEKITKFKTNDEDQNSNENNSKKATDSISTLADNIIHLNMTQQEELESFSQNIQIKHKNLQSLWNKIKRCILFSLLQKSHQSYSKNDRVEYYVNNKDKKINEIRILANEYISLRSIGTGNSYAYLIYYILEEKLFVMKIFREDKEEEKLYEREHCNYQKLFHPFMPRYIGYIEENGHKYLVIEYIEGVTLNNINNMNLEMKYKIKIIFQIMIFIEHLHLNKFVYRDLKPNNVIFDINKTTIIFDFDRMIGCKENVSDTIVTTQDFSHLYVAPEVVSGQHFSYEADIYSLGLVIYFIFFGKPPPLKNIIDSETSEFDFDKFDDDFTIFRKICEDCTCKIPNKRPRLSNIINIVFTNFWSKYYEVLIENDTMKSIDNIHDKTFCSYWIYVSEIENYFCMFEMGRLYHLNINKKIPKDINKALHYYHCSIKCASSKNNIGSICLDCHDINKAILFFTLAADQNFVLSQINLGNIYERGEGIPRNIDKAIHYYTLAADQNNDLAQFKLGDIYHYGKGVPKNIDKAIHYYTLAAVQNNANSIFALGCIYDRTEYGVSNQKKAFKYYFQAAKLNHPKAQYNIGNYYYNGVVVEKNFYKAYEYYLMAANQNHPYAQCMLGRFYHDGFHSTKDLLKAVKYYKLAANQNNRSAQNDLGSLYLNEFHDIEKAIYYFTLSANLKSPEAQCNLGYIFYEGKYTEKNISKAMYYLSLAADQNYPLAHNTLGNIYFKGDGVPCDMNKAAYYYRLASNHGIVNSQYTLGLIFLFGLNGSKSIDKAVHYFTLAAKKYYVPALYILGNLYFEGKLIERNVQKAILYYKDGSSFNFNYAKNNLGIIYKNGFETTKNIVYAIELFNEAIKQKDDKISMYNLANIYIFDCDVKKDYEKSLKLLVRSSKNNFIYSKILLCILLIKMLKNITVNDITNEIKDEALAKELYELIIRFNMTNAYVYQTLFDTFSKIDFYYNIWRMPAIFSSSEFKKQKVISNNGKCVEINDLFYDGFGRDLMNL